MRYRRDEKANGWKKSRGGQGKEDGGAEDGKRRSHQKNVGVLAQPIFGRRGGYYSRLLLAFRPLTFTDHACFNPFGDGYCAGGILPCCLPCLYHLIIPDPLETEHQPFLLLSLLEPFYTTSVSALFDVFAGRGGGGHVSR